MDKFWTLVNESVEYLLVFQGILVGAALTMFGYTALNESSGGSALATICICLFVVVSSLRGMAERHKWNTAQSTRD